MSAAGTVEIAVFQRNLRVHDNPVLVEAATAADQTLPLFVLDPAIAGSSFTNSRRQQVLNSGLADLDVSLRQLGAALVIRRGNAVEEIARLAEQVNARRIHVAADVSGYAKQREDRLRRHLAQQRRELVVHQAVNTVQAAGSVTPHGSDHFAVFTPYFRRWAQTARRPVKPVPDHIRLPPNVATGAIPTGGQVADWAGGETAARTRADEWIRGHLGDYEDRHDDLAADQTSHLSPYLHFGFISALELVSRVERHEGPGPAAFVRQLAWRDFHHQVLAARPDAAWNDYRSRGDRWRRDDQAWQAWRYGMTGYPVVDAGMRQLAATGWMHNRARLIVASFLTKTLYLDWRPGASHFLSELVDGDLANNNLNWQWVAGTGNDTRPNRVLNPLRQAERFDAMADYVRRWVPELAGLDDPKQIHQPWRIDPVQRRTIAYPAPIVDLAQARAAFARYRR